MLTTHMIKVTILEMILANSLVVVLVDDVEVEGGGCVVATVVVSVAIVVATVVDAKGLLVGFLVGLSVGCSVGSGTGTNGLQ